MAKNSKNTVAENTVAENVVVAENTVTGPTSIVGVNTSVFNSFKSSLSTIPVTSISEDKYFDKDGNIVTRDVYKFSYTHGKNSSTVTVRDSATINSLTIIERLATLDRASAYIICSEVRKIKLEVIKKLGFDSVWDFIKACFDTKLDINTLSRYYRISRLFFDDNGNYRAGLDIDIPISNLDVASAIFQFKKNAIKIEDLSDKECENMFDTFYREYIVTEKIVLSLSQKKLKEQVQQLIKGTVDNKPNKGADDMNKGADDMNKGADDMNKGADDMNKGADDMNKGADDMNKGADVDTTKNEEKKLEAIKDSIATISVLITDDTIKDMFTKVCDHVMSKLA